MGIFQRRRHSNKPPQSVADQPAVIELLLGPEAHREDRAGVLQQLLRAQPPVVQLVGEVDPHAPEFGARDIEVELAASEQELRTLQLGFVVHALTGENLTRGAGAWNPAWLVVGMDYFNEDPYFVDFASPGRPVFTAEHGRGRWASVPVSPTLTNFLTRAASSS